MALKLDYTTQGGEHYPEAYLVVLSVKFNPAEINPAQTMISLGWYAKKEDRDMENKKLNSPELSDSDSDGRLLGFNYTVYKVAQSDYPSGDVFSAAYTYLLTLPEFKDAVLVD